MSLAEKRLQRYQTLWKREHLVAEYGVLAYLMTLARYGVSYSSGPPALHSVMAGSLLSQLLNPESQMQNQLILVHINSIFAEIQLQENHA